MDIDPQAFGRNGAYNVDSGEGTIIGQWYAIQFLGETVVTTLTASNDEGQSITGTYADGMVIYGNFLSIAVSSGIARCYKTRPLN